MPRGLARGLTCCWLALGVAPAASEGPADAADDAEADEAVQGIADMDCWEKHVTYEPLDMTQENQEGVNITKEPTPLACQQRCEQTYGCKHFAYWAQEGHCHLQDVFAIRTPNRFGFVSGPQRCYRDDEEALSHGMARLQCKGVGDYTWVQVELSCLEVQTMYSSFKHVQSVSFDVAPADQDPLEAVLKCQQLCRDTDGCAHFSVGLPGLECALAGAQSPVEFPISSHVSGPPDNCTELFYQKLDSPATTTQTATTTTTTTTTVVLGGGGGRPAAPAATEGAGPPWWFWAVVALVVALCLLAAALAAFGMLKSKPPKKKTRSVEVSTDQEDPPSPVKPLLPAPGPLRPMLTVVEQALTPWWPQYQRQPPHLYEPVATSDTFDAIDRNHDGVIDRNEFNKALASPRAATYVASTRYFASPRAATLVASAPGNVQVPMATASLRVVGPDRDRNGIPDCLEGGKAQAISAPLARQPSQPTVRRVLPQAPQAASLVSKPLITTGAGGGAQGR